MGGVAKRDIWVSAALCLLLACGDAGLAPTSGSTPQPTEAQANSAGTPAAAGGSGGSGGAAAPRKNTGGAGATGSDKKPEMKPGMTDFVSADPRAGSATAQLGPSGFPTTSSAASPGAATAGSAAPATPAAGSTDGAVGRLSVERGDIYRVLGDQRLLNLNGYRGLQVIDVRDLSQPKLEGRLPVAGQPVEMYVVGDRAFVLLNNWQGYHSARDDLRVRGFTGGLVMSVDLRDRAHPALIDQAEVNGNILTSRLTQKGDQIALYVAAFSNNGAATSIVKSFDVSSGKLNAKSEIDLGSYVQDVQATTDLMLVSSLDWNTPEQRSMVTVIDISRADGVMTRGGTVKVQGMVPNKFNMDAYKGVLRVVSGSNGGGSLENHLQTFSLANLQSPTPIDDCKLGHRDLSNGGSEMLYATIFIENRAFFVTYFRTDPFHAFSIDDAGKCAEHNEFIVSGWNDFLRPSLSNTRLIGIGRNDQNFANRLSVSLYDAVNLDNRTPLLARADLDLSATSSEANWDDRGFSVIEDATNVRAADGTSETGLILLPYTGYDPNANQQIHKVQLLTFSNRTLTRRGVMDHGSDVRRSFEIDTDTTANLSEQQLSLFDTANPDAPKELGRLDVAPSYTRVFSYGDHIARLRENLLNYYPATVQQTPRKLPQNAVQVLAKTSDPDGSDVIASFEVPAGGRLMQVGSLLVSVYTETTYDAFGQNPKSQTRVQVFDLADPSKPRARGTLQTDRIEPSYNGGFYPMAGFTTTAPASIPQCFNCYPGVVAPFGYVVDQAIVFPRTQPQQRSEGWVTHCSSYVSGGNCYFDEKNKYVCGEKFYTGGIQCITPENGMEACSGQFFLCDQRQPQQRCEPVEPPKNTNRNCNTFEQFRVWQSYAFDTLDLRDPDAPRLTDRVSLPQDEETSSLVAIGDTLYYNFQKPYQMPNDARRYVKHYVRLIGFDDPGNPSRGEAINIPGDVIAADGDTVYTRDFVWNNTDARTLVARLTLSDTEAKLEASQLFEDRSVSAVKLDGKNHVLVRNDPAITQPMVASSAFGTAGSSAPVPGVGPTSKLSILDAQSLSKISEADIDQWASFQDANGGRALYQVGGGLLVINVEDAQKPRAQAFFPTSYWPSEFLFDGTTILFAAGPYGIYRFDANVDNLLKQ